MGDHRLLIRALPVPAVQLDAAAARQQRLAVDLHRRFTRQLVAWRREYSQITTESLRIIIITTAVVQLRIQSVFGRFDNCFLFLPVIYKILYCSHLWDMRYCIVLTCEIWDIVLFLPVRYEILYCSYLWYIRYCIVLTCEIWDIVLFLPVRYEILYSSYLWNMKYRIIDLTCEIWDIALFSPVRYEVLYCSQLWDMRYVTVLTCEIWDMLLFLPVRYVLWEELMK